MKIYRLVNTIQEYPWGTRNAISKLLGVPNEDRRPQAELWMGAHPKAPSKALTDSGEIPLSNLVELDPGAILGESILTRFGPALPFLFKVLSAEHALSIQAHPNRRSAEGGFDREDRLGIPIDAPHRNYRDINHKPEIICALTPFWAMTSFRPPDAIIGYLSCISHKALKTITSELERRRDSEGIRILFEGLMKLDESERVGVTEAAVNESSSGTGDREAWDWVTRLADLFPGDIGILSPLFLNLIKLEPGQALYLDAGELHAYLQGTGIELMANSDNVLRGGLTSKHVDVPELLKNLTFRYGAPPLIEGSSTDGIETVYSTKSKEFLLSRISLSDGQTYSRDPKSGVEILLCVQGGGSILSVEENDEFGIGSGDSFIVPADAGSYTLRGDLVLYRARVPGKGH